MPTVYVALALTHNVFKIVRLLHDAYVHLIRFGMGWNLNGGETEDGLANLE